MSMGKRGKVTNKSRENTSTLASNERESMFGEIPGKVVSFNKDNQTATIQPLYKPVHNGEPVDMPELLEVPVRFPRQGGFVMTTPVKPGDKVNLRPQLRSTEEYHTGSDHMSVSDSRSTSLSDMEAYLDGGESVSEPISNFNNENFEIRSEDGSHKIELSEDGKFRIVGSEGNVYELLTQVVELLASDKLDVKYGSSIGSGHALENQLQYEEIAVKLRAMVLR